MVMARKMNTLTKEQWELNHDKNLRFWRGKLPQKAMSFNRVFPLYPYFEELIGDKREISIADLGAGILSTTGSVWPGVEVKVYPSDYYADDYAELFKYWKITPVFPIEYQDMEKLTYQDESFDIVHCANALDHTLNPNIALREMYRVCKHDGWIYLRHSPNEGERHRYSMQHQWNITIENGIFTIWNKYDKVELEGEPVTIVCRLHKE